LRSDSPSLLLFYGLSDKALVDKESWAL
jgi:hypothetical protein